MFICIPSPRTIQLFYNLHFFKEIALPPLRFSCWVASKSVKWIPCSFHLGVVWVCTSLSLQITTYILSATIYLLLVVFLYYVNWYVFNKIYSRLFCSLVCMFVWLPF
jgi:hypothetical protein